MGLNRAIILFLGAALVLVTYQNCGPQIAETASQSLSSRSTSWSTFRDASGPVIIAGTRTCGWTTEKTQLSLYEGVRVNFVMSADFPAGSNVVLRAYKANQPLYSDANGSVQIYPYAIDVHYMSANDYAPIQVTGQVLAANGTVLCTASPLAINMIPRCEMRVQYAARSDAGIIPTTTYDTAKVHAELLNLPGDRIAKIDRGTQLGDELAIFIMPPAGLTLDSAKQRVELISTKNGDDDTPDNFCNAAVCKSDLLKSFANINETGKTDYKRGLKMVLQGGIGGSAWLGNYTMRAKVLGSGDYVICETPSAEGDRTSMTIKGPDPLPSVSPTPSATPCAGSKPHTAILDLGRNFDSSFLLVCADHRHFLKLTNSTISFIGLDSNYSSTSEIQRINCPSDGSIGTRQLPSGEFVNKYDWPLWSPQINRSLTTQFQSIQKATISMNVTTSRGYCLGFTEGVPKDLGPFKYGDDPGAPISVNPPVSDLMNNGIEVAVCPGGDPNGQTISYNRVTITLEGTVANNCTGQ